MAPVVCWTFVRNLVCCFLNIFRTLNQVWRREERPEATFPQNCCYFLYGYYGYGYTYTMDMDFA